MRAIIRWGRWLVAVACARDVYRRRLQRAMVLLVAATLQNKRDKRGKHGSEMHLSCSYRDQRSSRCHQPFFG